MGGVQPMKLFVAVSLGFYVLSACTVVLLLEKISGLSLICHQPLQFVFLNEWSS